MLLFHLPKSLKPNNKVVVFEKWNCLLKRIKKLKLKHKYKQCKNGKTRSLQNGNQNLRPLIGMVKEVFEDHLLEGEKLTENSKAW